MPIPLGPVSDTWRGPPLLASGHRPFFLFAGLYGAAAPLLWLLAWRGLLPLTSAWHGHEMIFGFAIAAIAGFLQAAVPKWTDGQVYRGARVAGLMVLWLLGRAGMAIPGAEWLDLLFLPVLAWFIGRQILRAGNVRNYPVPALLTALWSLDLLYHFGNSSLALRVAVYLVAALIALIGGRIVPIFTQNALRANGFPNLTCNTPRWLDLAAVPAVVAVAATELLWPMSRWSGLAAGLTAVLLGWRMLGWQTAKTRGLPLVWVLHAGYAFLPLGMLLKAIADLGGAIGPFAALHALTAGAIGVMILAVASRAALGHSGRPLQPARATVVAYGLVIAGAMLRVAWPHPHVVLLAGLLWSAGFALFSAVYWPILTKPRLDGVAG